MSKHHIPVRWVAGTLCGFAVFMNPASAQGRGESLYSTHCGACHTAQMHWRANGAVKDWAGLKDEVRKWQVVASLAWTEDDVLDVARYLNDSVYHFEQTSDRLSSTRTCAGRLDASATCQATCREGAIARHAQR